MKVFGPFLSFSRSLWTQRGTIWELARRDFISQHSGTILGVFWNYVQPLTYALMVTIVFSVGLRHNPGHEVPYLPFLISGMTAWHFFAAAWAGLSGIIRAHSFLVRKGNFNLAILPLGKLLSQMVPHLAVIVATVGICWLKGFPPSLYSLQVLYYLAAMLCLLLGLGWITSATSLFIEDIHNLVGVFIQFGFWLTPIIWNIKMIPAQYRWIVNLNPAYYFVNGYRNSFVYRIPFWERPHVTLYYWLFTLTVLIVGAVIFRRLKPHFGEVL
jgi:lipopolysaccharide transport system permease protein/teichoic acid transport system permease protein